MRILSKKKEVAEKRLFITYTIICGEFEFIGHHICVSPKRQKDETIIHNYFENLYPDLDNCFHFADSYTYMEGQVGVKRISWEKITPEQKEVLNSVGIY